MVTLEELIETLKEILNLDNENYGANVYIGGKYLFIRRPNLDVAYFIEL